jgi:(p)ppGpp synthase/HD superfamily hydrolase
MSEGFHRLSPEAHAAHGREVTHILLETERANTVAMLAEMTETGNYTREELEKQFARDRVLTNDLRKNFPNVY